jgi:hypothetical protein
MSIEFGASGVDFSQVAGSRNAVLAAVAMMNGDCSVPLQQFVAQNNAKAALAGMGLPDMQVCNATEVGLATGGISLNQEQGRGV